MVTGPAGGYERTRSGIYRVRLVGSTQLRFAASNLRPERTGFHARIDIQANGVTLAFDVFNVERDAERTRLANSAYAKLIGGRPSRDRPELAEYPAVYLQDDLDQFCDGLRSAYIEDMLPRPMAGSLERIGPSFLLKPYILADGGTICFAPPGYGKSYVLWVMGVCVDAGLSDLWPVRRAKVLVLNLERPKKSVEQRLGNINAVLGLERDRPLDVINARGRTLQDIALAVRQHIERSGTELVLLDSLSRAGPGSLIEDDVVNGYCNILNSFQVAWFALGHSPRADQTHLFGSQMFDAAADLMVRLLAQEKMRGPLGVALDLIKRNDVAKHPMWIGALEFDGDGLVGIRVAKPGEFHELEAGEKMSMEDRVAQHMARMGVLSATVLADDLGFNRANVADMLKRNERFVEVRKEGQSVLYGLRAGNTSGRATDGQQPAPWWAAN